MTAAQPLRANSGNQRKFAEKLKPFFASVDALRWLNYQAVNKRAKLWKDPPSRYLMVKSVTNNFFSLTFNDDGIWVLATYDIPAMQWFPLIPWKKCILQEQKGGTHTLSLVCTSQHIDPIEDLNFPGGTMSGFSIDFCIPSRVANLFEMDKIIHTGLFKPDKASRKRDVDITVQGGAITLAHKGLSVKRKEVK